MRIIRWTIIFVCLGFIAHAAYKYYTEEISFTIISGVLPTFIGIIASLIEAKSYKKPHINQKSGNNSPNISNSKGSISINYTSREEER